MILVPLGNLAIAADNNILARKGRHRHYVAGPRPVEVSQQRVYSLEAESRVNVEIYLYHLGFHSDFLFTVDKKGLKSSHDRHSDADIAASLCPGPFDLCCSLVSNLEFFGPESVFS